MDPEDQYRLITELLEPEFGSLYVTPPDIDERVRQLSFTIFRKGIHRGFYFNRAYIVYKYEKGIRSKEMSAQKTKAAGHLAAIFTMLIWGTTFISTKVLLEDLSPLEILVLRFVAGYIFLWIIRPVPLKVGSLKQEGIMIAAGITGIGIYYLMENIALTLTQASNISVIVSIAPIFTGILAHFFLEGEKMKKSIVLGFVCAMAGICLITFQKGETVELNPLGDFLGVAAAAIWGVYSICSRKIAGFGYDTIITTRRTFFYGILFMLCALPFMDFHLSLSALLKPVNLGNIIYLGVGASAICFVTWNYAVKSLGATRASVYIYGIPVVTILNVDPSSP